MKKYIICIVVALMTTACEMPQMPTVNDCKRNAVRMFKQRHGLNGKLNIRIKREDDGYEFMISDGRNMEEIDCSFWNQCNFD